MRDFEKKKQPTRRPAESISDPFHSLINLFVHKMGGEHHSLYLLSSKSCLYAKFQWTNIHYAFISRFSFLYLIFLMLLLWIWALNLKKKKKIAAVAIQTYSATKLPKNSTYFIIEMEREHSQLYIYSDAQACFFFLPKFC